MSLNLPSGKVQLGKNSTADILTCMESRCLGCNKEINVDEGVIIAIGTPYFALVHYNCAALVNWNDKWPHSYPAKYYIDLADHFKKNGSPGPDDRS